jgi:hypothetical protein
MGFIENVNILALIESDISNVSQNMEGLQDISDNLPEILLADKFANEAENIEVKPGKYSAFHWSEKAKSFAQGLADNISVIDVTNASGDVIITDNVQVSLAALSNAIDSKLATADLLTETKAVLGDTLDSKLDTADLLTEIKAIDGPGSGLDADKLDGVHLSSIAKKTDYATDRTGGTIKMRVSGSTLYITNDGTNA